MKQLMRQHGVEAVRGGTYSRVHLDDAQVAAIRKEITHASRQAGGATPPPKSRRAPVSVAPVRSLQLDELRQSE